jgi:hypothetical protein
VRSETEIKSGRVVQACALYDWHPPPEIPSAHSVSDPRPFVMYKTALTNLAELQISLRECFFV